MNRNDARHRSATTTPRRAGTRHSRARRRVLIAFAAVALASVASQALASAAAPGLTALPNDGRIALTWVPDPHVDHYVVHRDGVQLATTEGTTFVDAVTNGRRHAYEVLGVGNAGATELVGRVAAIGQDLEAPTMAGHLSARIVGAGALDITWYVGSPAPDALRYHVTVNGEVVGTSASTQIHGMVHVTGLAEGVVSYVSLLVEDLVGNTRVVAGPVAAGTLDPRIPPVPVGLRARSCGNGIDLAWDAFGGASGGVVASWDVFRDGVRIERVTEPSFLDRTAPAGTPASYSVVARRPTGKVSLPTPPILVTRSLKGGCIVDVYRPSQSVPDLDVTALWDRTSAAADGARRLGASILATPRQDTGELKRVAGLATYVDGVLARVDGPDSGGRINTSFVTAPSTAGTSPSVAVAYIDTDGLVGPRVAVTAPSLPTPALAAPTDVAAHNGSERLELSWVHAHATGYEVRVDGVRAATVTGSTRAVSLAPLTAIDTAVVRVIAIAEDGAASLASEPLVITPRASDG